MPTKWLYNQGTDALMTTGIGIREALIKDHFVNSEYIFSVPSGIDTEHYQIGNLQHRRFELNLPNNHYIFGIVAALRSWKGHIHLIEAFGKLNQDDTTLLIVGDGAQMTNYQALAQSMPNAKNIHFVGNQSDVTPYLQAMDCFVLPSYANEGVPQALLQAMAVGLPIISCPVGGIPECLENFEQSTLVEPKNSEALKSAMASQLILEKLERLPRKRHIPFDLNRLYNNALNVYKKATE
jgi:glycosyltransferase involved in cell wall biosynthesis